MIRRKFPRQYHHRNARHVFSDNVSRHKKRKLNCLTKSAKYRSDKVLISLEIAAMGPARFCRLFRQTCRKVTCRSRQRCRTKTSADGDNCYVNKRIKYKKYIAQRYGRGEGVGNLFCPDWAPSVQVVNPLRGPTYHDSCQNGLRCTS